MLITTEQLASYTGVHFDSEDETQAELYEIFIGSAQAEIIDYLGFNPEESESLSEFAMYKIKDVCLEIAALIAMESGNNLGVNSSSDIGGISRTFLNVVDFSKYLQKLSAYRTNLEM